MYVWWKEKKTVFLYNEKKKNFLLRINVDKDWLRDHSSWVPCGIGMLIRGILKSRFWILLHQGMLSIFCSRILSYMLSLMNEIDPCLLLSLYVLYEMKNQIFQQLVLERSSISCLYSCITCDWVLELKKNIFLVFQNSTVIFCIILF